MVGCLKMGVLTVPLLLLGLCLSTSYGLSCPTQCTCTTVDLQYRVDCSNQGLTTIPELPIDTDELDLSENSITLLPDNSFSSVGLLKKLDLSGNGLSLIELNAFQDMASLQTLNLSRNDLQADNFRDHEMLRGCRHIIELDLSSNRLTKIPDSGLKVLTVLQNLYLSNNALTSPVFGPGFQSLEDLELVDLSDNDFYEIPAEAFNVLVDRIVSINLSSCGIHRVQTGAFHGFQRLAHFDISNNEGINQRDLNASIKAICSSMFLSSLRLSRVNISDLNYVLTPILETDDMRYLDLSHNALRRLEASDLRPAKKIRTLNLSHNKLSALPSLGLHLLEKIDVSNNFIRDISNTPFDGASDLEEINLSNNKLEEFPSSMFSSNTMLKKLDLSFNEIRDVPVIDQLEEVRELSLQGNLISDPTYFFYMLSLTTLDLGSNRITAFTKDMLILPMKLTWLNLTRNQISYIERDSFNIWCPSTLDLSYNQLDRMDSWGLMLVENLYLQYNLIGQIREEDIDRLTFMKIFDLSGNMLSTLPTSMLSYLEDLLELNLANNNLKDFLEGEMGRQLLAQKTNLQSLNIASNGIKTVQPNLFTNLSMLRHLDLSQNHIHDMMGGQLQQLSVLQSLNLSSNRLNGFNHSIVTPLVSLQTLDLTGTQWQCDCSIAEVMEWMESTEVDIVGYETYRCSGPQANVNMLLQDYNTDEDGDCATTAMEKTIILIIIGCTSFVILVVAAIIFWQHRCRLKKKLKKQHYRAMYERAQMPLPNNNDGAIAQTEYHSHPHHHHSHLHTPNLSQKGMCPEHNPSGHAFV